MHLRRRCSYSCLLLLLPSVGIAFHVAQTYDFFMMDVTVMDCYVPWNPGVVFLSLQSLATKACLSLARKSNYEMGVNIPEMRCCATDEYGSRSNVMLTLLSYSIPFDNILNLDDKHLVHIHILLHPSWEHSEFR